MVLTVSASDTAHNSGYSSVERKHVRRVNEWLWFCQLRLLHNELGCQYHSWGMYVEAIDKFDAAIRGIEVRGVVNGCDWLCIVSSALTGV